MALKSVLFFGLLVLLTFIILTYVPFYKVQDSKSIEIIEINSFDKKDVFFIKLGKLELYNTLLKEEIYFLNKYKVCFFSQSGRRSVFEDVYFLDEDELLEYKKFTSYKPGKRLEANEKKDFGIYILRKFELLSFISENENVSMKIFLNKGEFFDMSCSEIDATHIIENIK